MEQVSSSFSNATSFFPSSADLLMAVPRLLQRAGSFADHMDNIFGRLGYGGSVIAAPTASNVSNATTITSSGTFVQESLAATARATGAVQKAANTTSPMMTLKNISAFFSYVTSKWAIATFTTAILLNRTYFYASSRVPLSLNRWHVRFILYVLPTVLFVYRIQWILQALRCQTSPDWPQIQYGSLTKQLDTDFAGEGGFLFKASSTLLFWQDVEESCRAANMLPPDPGSPRASGSLALLWPLFVSIGFSQFIETLACALQSRQPVPETGMTIFEHSLAFAEAEAVVSKPLASDATRFWKPLKLNTPDGTLLTLSRTSVTRFANVPPEVLLIALISSLSHFTSNLLAMVGLRAKIRLFTTAVWGIAYISAFVWSFLKASSIAAEHGPQLGILRFPTVCIVGFIPHLLILMGILACGTIYALAFILTVISPPPGQPSSFKERFSTAYRNLQANIHLSTITPVRINWQEDFYTAILKCGFTILTAASEAVYLNEGTRINVASMTWLEKKRLQEVISRRNMLQQSFTALPPELRGDSVANGITVSDRFTDDPRFQNGISGYGRERKARGGTITSDASSAVVRDNGVGLQQRRGRWTLTYQFLRGISMLLITIQAKFTLFFLDRLRIPLRPRWLIGLAGPRVNEKIRTSGSQPSPSRLAIPGDRGEFTAALMGQADVEESLRKRVRDAGLLGEEGSQAAEETFTDFLYNWWKVGGWWGEDDNSGEYVPSSEDDDATSVISMAPSEEDAWSDVDDGQRTPTQDSPFPYSRESTPAPERLMDISRLSHLLDPQTQEEKEEARLLAHRLKHEKVLTRSQYRKIIERDQIRILTSSRFPGNPLLSPNEEEEALEQFILQQRDKASTARRSTGATWDSGAEGMGSDGPQCVVCQMSPRTVLVWPCGCLSLCDDCRVGLATKNYTTCVCCRTNVVAYSRLYVP